MAPQVSVKSIDKSPLLIYPSYGSFIIYSSAHMTLKNKKKKTKKTPGSIF